jgi:hypothetical protein
VAIRLDRSAPGAHLLWDVTNTGTTPIALTKLVLRPRHGRRAPVEMRSFGAPKRLAPGDEVVIATDVEWSMLDARSIALVDEADRAFPAPARQLSSVQEQLHGVIDRRESTISARDFLFGAGDLAVGAVLLGLGFFMLMWVIATG